MNDVKNVLSRAADLLADGWIKGTLAKDVDGRVVGPRSKRACKFCALGAIERATCDMLGPPLDKPVWLQDGMELKETMRSQRAESLAREALEKALHKDYSSEVIIERWNDDEYTTHDEVLLYFKEAIDAA